MKGDSNESKDKLNQFRFDYCRSEIFERDIIICIDGQAEKWRKAFGKNLLNIHKVSLAKAKYIYDKDGEDNYWDHPDKIYWAFKKAGPFFEE